MKPVYGRVIDAGGGELLVIVDRDTDHYLPVGTRVIVKPSQKGGGET